MAAVRERVKFDAAYKAAIEVMSALAGACDRIEIVGSLRRGLTGRRLAVDATVGDIEILAAPSQRCAKLPAGRLFDVEPEPDRNRTALCDLVDHLTARTGSKLIWDPDLKRRGLRYKRLAWCADGWRIPVDLFVAVAPASWGALQAIRTGPADFSQLLVTSQARGGAMPPGLRQIEGCLCRLNDDGTIRERIPSASEAEWFAAIGVPDWPPAERSAAKLREFLGRRAIDARGEESQCRG